MATELEAIAAANTVLEKANTTIIGRIAKLTKISHANIRLALGVAFEHHLTSTFRRLSTVRTILTKDKQEELLSIYVNLNLKSDGEEIFDYELIDKLQTNDRILIEGTGGAGKSMLLKYLVIHCLNNPNGKIPIFIELRGLSFDNNETLENIIFDKICENGNEEPKYLFLKAIGEGLVALFLDGLDEIPSSSRDAALQKINSFSARYNKPCVIISSRPGNNSDALSDFDIFNVQPLSQEQAISVIEKTNAPEELKQAFIEKLRGPLFTKNQTFLGIPLLVVMMLLTFSSYSDIPDRMSVFYEQAFSTLYAIHDTVSKGPYKREHFAKLAPDEFGRVFEAFCYLTLSKEKYEFIYSDIIEKLKDALAITQISATPYAFLLDLEESVCLIMKDGVQYVFVHRSFQEYFASKFALRYNGNNKYEIIDNCIGKEWEHNTIKLMNEIDPVNFRELWVLPALTNLHTALKDSESEPMYLRIGLLLGGWHVSQTMESSVDLDGEVFGIYPADREKKQNPGRLAIALSRITALPSPYDFFPPKYLLPEDRSEWGGFLHALDDEPGDCSSFIDFCEGKKRKRRSDDFGGLAMAVFNHSNNAKWLEMSRLGQRLSEYMDIIFSIKQEAFDSVQRQKDLEFKLL